MAQAFMSHFFIQPPRKKLKVGGVSFFEQNAILLNSPTDCFRRSLAQREEENCRLKSQISRLESQIAKATENKENQRKKLLKETRPFVAARKPFSELDPMRKSHKKAEITSWLSTQFEKLPSEWKVTQLKMKVGTEAIESTFYTAQEDIDAQNQSELMRIRRALKAKDDGDVSDAAYHELKQVPDSNLPSLCSLIKERKQQNKVIEVKEFNEDVIVQGCSRSIRAILAYLYQDPRFRMALEEGCEAGVARCRFSGDGRRTTKKLGSVMTTFCLPSENQEKRSPEKEYCISIYDGKESHDILEKCMKEVYHEMSGLSNEGIVLEGKVLRIDWLMCADWKFMACVMGINSPSATYFCLWCECSKKMIRDFSIDDWPISRTYNTCCDLAKLKEGQNRFGVQYPPMVEIEFDKVLPDTLHLKLRIMGKLLNQVACWAIEQKRKEEMVSAMSVIGVKFCFYETQDDSGKTTTKWSSLDLYVRSF